MYSIRRGIGALSQNIKNFKNKHTLPELPYAYNALEPVICGEIMELHHKKHHAAYVTNYNAAEDKLAEAVSDGNINQIISLQSALKFNGGGHLNHSVFWCNLSPDGGKPSDALNKAICESFKNVDEMKKQMMAMTNAIQGSGWGWLGLNPVTKRLQLATCANQDPLQATTGLIPLFGIDVWEHAYYLQYKNVRADYTKKIFEIVNWNDVNTRYENGICGK